MDTNAAPQTALLHPRPRRTATVPHTPCCAPPRTAPASSTSPARRGCSRKKCAERPCREQCVPQHAAVRKLDGRFIAQCAAAVPGGVQRAAFKYQHKAEGRYTVLVAAHRHRIVAVLADKICCTVDGVQIPHAPVPRGRGGIFLAYDGVARKGGQDALRRNCSSRGHSVLQDPDARFSPKPRRPSGGQNADARPPPAPARGLYQSGPCSPPFRNILLLSKHNRHIVSSGYHIASIRPLHGRETGLLARTYSATSSGISTLPRHNTGQMRSAS
jgi:hypothetical protein